MITESYCRSLGCQYITSCAVYTSFTDLNTCTCEDDSNQHYSLEKYPDMTCDCSDGNDDCGNLTCNCRTNNRQIQPCAQEFNETDIFGSCNISSYLAGDTCTMRGETEECIATWLLNTSPCITGGFVELETFIFNGTFNNGTFEECISNETIKYIDIPDDCLVYTTPSPPIECKLKCNCTSTPPICNNVTCYCSPGFGNYYCHQSRLHSK